MFRLLDWGDRVHVRVREDGVLARDGGDSAHLPEAEDLLMRAARALRSASGSPLGADLRVEKEIPAGGGFGGGSSDAATVLRVLDHLWATGLGEDRLAELGLGLGADVPVFVRGRNAWAEGLGERLTPIALPPAWYLLVDPGVPVPTGELFQAPELTRDAPPATIADFVSGTAARQCLRTGPPAPAAARGCRAGGAFALRPGLPDRHRQRMLRRFRQRVAGAGRGLGFAGVVAQSRGGGGRKIAPARRARGGGFGPRVTVGRRQEA